MMPTTAEPVLEDLRAILARYAPPGAPLEPETDLAKDLAIDSVAAMDIVMEIEERFDFDVPVSRIPDLRTVGDLVALVVQSRQS
jgi:acyl carrier protein